MRGVERLTARTRRLGLAVALDLASPQLSLSAGPCLGPGGAWVLSFRLLISVRG